VAVAGAVAVAEAVAVAGGRDKFNSEILE